MAVLFSELYHPGGGTGSGRRWQIQLDMLGWKGLWHSHVQLSNPLLTIGT